MQTNPERLAWRVLLIAFGVFLLLCAATIYAAQWYLFSSDVGLRVELTAARGTVRMLVPNTEEPIAVTDRRSDQRLPFEVRTDTSQASIRFSDPRSGQSVASVALLYDSRLSLMEATGPRFNFNHDPYQINLQMESGRIEVLTLDGLRDDTELVLSTPHGTTTITSPGHYIVDTTTDRTRLTVEQGLARINAPTSNSIIEVPAGHTTTITRSRDVPSIISAESDLLDNSGFSEPFTEGWEFYDDSVLPSGSASNTTFDGRIALSLDRSQENWPGQTLDHGETGLRQDVELDVSSYDYLELRGTFYLQEQSLSTCGEQGSECPVMIRMEYVDVQGTEREYIQGFYAYHDPSLNYPLTCDSCRTEHERITLQSWYTFRSGNLFTSLPAEQKPAYIQQIRVYASGHAYETYVSQLELRGSP